MRDRIVCVGVVVHDEVYRVDTLPAAGIKIAANAFEQRFGGPAATGAVAIAGLGGRAAFWGRVGDDAPGDAALAALKRHRVDCAGVSVVAGGQTRRAVVLVDSRGERCIVAYRKGLPDDARLLSDDTLDGVAVVLVDSRWPEGALAILARARARGIPTVVDADGGPRADAEHLVRAADHVIFSAEGLRDLAGRGALEQQLRAAAAPSAKVVAVTRGAEGSLWLVDGTITAVPAFRVAVADSTGCGDVFHGAYALAIGEGMAPLAAARFASAAAAIKAERGRGWEGMPDRAALARLLAT
jgi:sulfofructose kinase